MPNLRLYLIPKHRFLYRLYTKYNQDLGCILYTIGRGIGVWGLNTTVGWAWDITNFVWWVGIGHAGTLISAVLLLFRQKWRMAINRSAEAMTIFAVMMAALFPREQRSHHNGKNSHRLS